MQLALADLFCRKCESYVHPFLDACPACGSERTSRYSLALVDRAGDASLADDKRLQSAAGEVSMSYSLMARRGGGLGSVTSGLTGIPEAPSLIELIDDIASAVSYRGVGVQPGQRHTPNVDLRASGAGLELRDDQKSVLLTVDPTRILAATPAPRGTRDLANWKGLRFEGLSELHTLTVDGDGMIVTWRAPTGYRQLALGNRRGLFASKGRHDHYVVLVRWLGAASAVAAEARWREIGAEAYASELGLRGALTADGAGPSPGAVRRSETAKTVRDRLQELLELRDAQLVTEAEYERKRQEILDLL